MSFCIYADLKEEAIPTFNFLNAERRYVAGALFPPPDLEISAVEHGRAMQLLKSFDELDVHPLLGGLYSTLDSRKDIIKKLWGERELKQLEAMDEGLETPQIGLGEEVKRISGKQSSKK